MRKYFEVKQLSGTGTIKDVDTKSRTVSGYFSRFDNIDHDRDMIVYGAFTKTIKERGHEGNNSIVHLADHWMNTENVLGKPKLFELRDGGYFETRISNTQKGNDVLELYRDGVINQHSFGFKTTRAEDKKDYREIKEVIIYEISTVVLGANDQTPFTGFKSFSLDQLNIQYKSLTKAFDNGSYTDETFHLLDAQIKQLEQYIVDKASQSAPVEDATQKGDDDILKLLKTGSENLSLTLFNF